MKLTSVPILLFVTTLLVSCAHSETKPPAANGEEPVYLSESALPKGWPAPGPYNMVTRKEYPASRAAFTSSSGLTGGFWTLFKHIKRNNIPMTSPVEMVMKEEAGSDMKMEQMGFLYQSPAVGKTGSDGKTVDVRDIPALSVLGYTWQGPRDAAQIAKAKTAIDAMLTDKKLTCTSYRLFGYNSPSVPRKKQTYELQAILKKP